MKKIENFDKIIEAGEFKKLPAGLYVAKITNVIDNPDKEYLEIYFDIIEPEEYKGYFKSQGDRDFSKTIRSYKSTAMSFFKAFITAVEKSNAKTNYQWNWDEKSLVNKYVVVNMGEEEYDDGVSDEIKVIVKCQEFRSGDAFRDNKIKIPTKKCLSDDARDKFDLRIEQGRVATSATTPVASVDINEDDLPF